MYLYVCQTAYSYQNNGVWQGPYSTSIHNVFSVCWNSSNKMLTPRLHSNSTANCRICSYINYTLYLFVINNNNSSNIDVSVTYKLFITLKWNLFGDLFKIRLHAWCKPNHLLWKRKQFQIWNTSLTQFRIENDTGFPRVACCREYGRRPTAWVPVSQSADRP